MEHQKIYRGRLPLQKLMEQFGSPVYVYDEAVLRQRCRELAKLVSYDKFIVDYSMKANSNPALLKIIREEGLEVDVMSPGEIYIARMAGYTSDEIFYIGNNVSPDEMRQVIDQNIRISVDSLAQLEQYGRLAPGGSVAIRVNPGIGAGHHQKVVTAGKQTKFGINMEYLEQIKEILAKYRLTLTGINQHIGSLFMKSQDYLRSVDALMDFALAFPELEFIDLGGGFGIPYHKGEGEERLDLARLGMELDKLIVRFCQKYGRELCFRIEPGRYVVAECGTLFGTVHSVKCNHDTKYVGTDIGFNVLMRPILYDAHHEILVFRDGQLLDDSNSQEAVTVVGNICESGDILAKNRKLPVIREGDVLAIRDAGAYGHIMSSTYNGRLRPGEVLVTEAGALKEIRKQDSYEDLVRNYLL